MLALATSIVTSHYWAKEDFGKKLRMPPTPINKSYHAKCMRNIGTNVKKLIQNYKFNELKMMYILLLQTMCFFWINGVITD